MTVFGARVFNNDRKTVFNGPFNELVDLYHYLRAIRLRYKHFPEFNLHGPTILQKYYSISEERNYFMRRWSMSQRYEYFIDKHADLLLRVPDKYIATHLGMTVTTYSHIKSKYLENKRRKAKG